MISTAALLLVTLSLGAGAAAGAPPALRFDSTPRRVVQGNPLAVTVAVRPAGARCAIAVRYSDGSGQPGLAAQRAASGRATWRWQVTEATPAGAAAVVVSCGRAGRVARTITVVGSVVAPRLVVRKEGFSVRPQPFSGTSVSYGVVLENVSPQQDALNVSALVNFVDGANRLIGSAGTSIAAVGAGATYALGGELSFPGAAPVARLEVVLQVKGRAPRSLRLPPVSNVRVLPEMYEPAWVGSVEGELINDHPAQVLQNARLSVVVLDAAGAVVGGGSGYAFAALPPGARQFFKVSSGLKAIPVERAATALVSVEPTFVQATG